MPPIPTVTITVQDNGGSASLAVPQASVQVKVGCAIGGTVNQTFATISPQSLQSQFIGGPLVEAGGLVCQQGNVVIAVSCPVVTMGAATAVVPTVPGGSSSTLTVTLDATYGAWDGYYVKLRCLTGGTRGTDGIVVQVSLDAGRNWGPPISLGTAVVLYIGTGSLTNRVPGGTGVQIAFGTGTMVAGDSWQFSTTPPLWNDAGVTAALAAFFASQYAIQGVGSIHLVGPCTGGSTIAGVQTALATGATGYVYQRAIVELRDANAPTAWGGSTETEATWITALATYVSGSTAQSRVCADGGYYNTQSPYSNASAGLPSYRRPLAWSHAVRRTQIPIQRRAGRVKDGSYSTITSNPTTDSADGFIYHDERVTPGLNVARIASAMTWPKLGAGFFQCQEPLLSPVGSQFTELAIGNVLDAACDIAYAKGTELVSDDLLANKDGTLNPVERNKIQAGIQNAENAGIVQTASVSSVDVFVNPLANVRDTGDIPVTITVNPKAYVNGVSETINLKTGS